MPRVGQTAGGGRGRRGGGRGVSVCGQAYVSRLGGWARWILTFAMCAIPSDATIFWVPPLSGQRRPWRKIDKVIIVLLSGTPKLERSGLRRMHLIIIVVCCPRRQTRWRCVKRKVVGSRLEDQIKSAVLDGACSATHSAIHE